MAANPSCTVCGGTGWDDTFKTDCTECWDHVPRRGGMGETLRTRNSSAPPNISRKVAEPVDDSWKRRPRWSRQGDTFYIVVPKNIKGVKPGVTVTVHKADGTSKDEVLGEMYDKNDWGDTLWNPSPRNAFAKAETATITVVAAPPAELSDGMYRTANDTIYKVQLAVHGSGLPYAKRLVKLDAPQIMKNGKVKTHEFAYESGAIRKLRPEDKMSLEEAKAWGALYGTCCVCGITLTKEESIERGMGSTCAGKF